MRVETPSKFGIWLIPPVALGVAIRLFRLPQQLMGGDELHSVRLAVTTPLSEILTTFPLTDHSIPLTALQNIAMSLGLRVSELGFRMPAVLAGIALLIFIPWRLERKLGRRSSILLCWLLATSPLLICYSRIARSYLPMTLFAFAAVMALYSWSESPTRRSAISYMLASSCAVYLHLAAAPFVFAPFVLLLIEGIRRPRSVSVSLGPSLGLMFATAIAIAVPLAPLGGTLLDVIEAKRELSEIGLGTLAGSFQLVAGSNCEITDPAGHSVIVMRQGEPEDRSDRVRPTT